MFMARRKEIIIDKTKEQITPLGETEASSFISEEKKVEAAQLSEKEAQVITEIAREIETFENEANREEENKGEGSIDRAIDSITRRLRKPKKIKARPIPQVRDEVTLKVEKILEEGLKDAFLELDTVQKQEFKIKGEATAFAIRTLLKNTHIKVKSIFRLILEWLKILPGVNRFFLEQEAKIKTDKIMAIHEQEKKRRL